MTDLIMLKNVVKILNLKKKSKSIFKKFLEEISL